MRLSLVSTALVCALAAAAPAPAPTGGLALNEDNSHFFSTRAGHRVTAAEVDAFVDQYAGTQVRELFFSPNSMRTSYGSKGWDPIWRGYDPDGPDDQPLLASTPEGARKGARKWVHTAWQLDRDGIDVYARWISRARARGISPWLSMRMNDVHNTDDERSYMHSEFWRANPQYRRVRYRFAGLTDRAFDYGRPEVREYHLKLVRELAERYDFDGLELDWMRFGFHFRPGHESQGLELLTRFTADVRKILNAQEKKRGHPIRLGARVPSRPQTALGLGYDPVRWAREGLIDMLVVTPFWATAETDIPIEVWKQLLAGTRVTLAAGLEVLMRGFPASKLFQKNSTETARGMAASVLDRGADRVYLFNYMDSETAMEDLENYPRLLREAGSLATMVGKPRRHPVTFADTWAPGEPRAAALPAQCEPERWVAFRIHSGPRPETGGAQARIGIEGAGEAELKEWDVRVNGTPCPFAGVVNGLNPGPPAGMVAYQVPLAAINRGYNLVEIRPRHTGKIIWAEIALGL
ncbi:MAG TPA: hypothetical protein VN442_06990 [Bryobacteraceae bacterium]|nr:hypothetical protein [Bryobacteraceae bacterium]